MREFLKKWLPTNADLKKNYYLQAITKKLRNAHVWRMDRRSTARGVAIGLLVCFLPLPCQMLLAALLACLFCGNLSIAILMTWISNPLTFVPINLFICQVGAWVLGVKSKFPTTFPALEWTHESAKLFAHDLYLFFCSLGKIYIVGLPIVALGSSFLGYVFVQLGWRWMMNRKKQHRI